MGAVWTRAVAGSAWLALQVVCSWMSASRMFGLGGPMKSSTPRKEEHGAVACAKARR